MLFEREPKFPGFAPWLDDTKDRNLTPSAAGGAAGKERGGSAAPGEAISSQKRPKSLKIKEATEQRGSAASTAAVFWILEGQSSGEAAPSLPSRGAS